jgi:hypothetical protein
VFKELQITLYDIFGYLLPGSIILIAVVILFWSLFWPSAPFALIANVPTLPAIGLLFSAYLAGHLGQGIANFLEKLPNVRRKLEIELPLSAELSQLVRDAVAERFGYWAKWLKSKELVLLCDQALICACSPGEREIFIYREGFYRGNCVALALLGLTLAVRLICSPAIIYLGDARIEIHRIQLILAALIAAFGTCLSFRRYIRFSTHKNATCLARFLALTKEPSRVKEAEKKSQ